MAESGTRCGRAVAQTSTFWTGTHSK